MSAVTDLERAMDRWRHLGAPVVEGTEPNGWLTALPTATPTATPSTSAAQTGTEPHE